MKVAIVGGGLIGRLAAWATMVSGHTPYIFDRVPEAIIPRGFVYLHDNCGLPLTPQPIYVYNTGGEGVEGQKAYAEKVYGDSEVPNSFGRFEGQTSGYDPAEALNILNGLQHGMVIDSNFKDMNEIVKLRETYERVIFTIPIKIFVPGVWNSRRGSVGVYKLNEGEVLKNFCVYSADPNIDWYRSGSMFGYAFREFAKVIPGHRIIEKVETEGSNKAPVLERILFTGRFGSWTKQLSHESFAEATTWLST